MKPLLIAAVGRSLGSAPLGRREDDVEVRRVPVFPTAASLDPDRPTVLLLDRQLLHSLGDERSRLEEVAKVVAVVGQGDPGDDEPPADFPMDLLTSFIPGGAAAGTVITQLRGAFRHAASMVAERHARAGEQQRYYELTELTKVGVALSTERNLLTLLEMILNQARRISNSDACSLYLVEKDENDVPKTLRFKLSQTFSLPNLPFSEFTIPIDHSSLAGYTAATGEPLSIADVYLLPADSGFKMNRSFDEKFGYRTKSMLVIPMKSHKDEIVGVLQLINRKKDADALLSSPAVAEREVLTYDQRSVELVNALASQAAVAIENSKLYEDIEKLFEGFVTAAVTAIESRDPTTFGHSGRVATMTVGLAEVIDRVGSGPYRDVRFTREQLRELRYAGLLHDFGKVGVREQVLVKQKKLYPADLELIQHRFSFMVQGAELEFERARAEFLKKNGTANFAQVEQEMLAALRARRLELERFRQAIIKANEPSVLPEEASQELQRIAQVTFTDITGEDQRLLNDDELRFLTIRRGTLDESERKEIESHVSHTFRFLQQIPWTRELRDVAKIAYGHHEKLNGSGYPRRVTEPEIPVQTRMMTISDIFDALTASDRPYKPAVPSHRAIDILHMEAKDGMLDKDLLDAFIEAKVFDAVLKA